MGPIPDAIVVRGEVVSAIFVVAALLAAARPLATLLGLSGTAVSDLYLNGAIAFVGAGRVAFLVLEDRAGLTDPLVAVQIQGGIEPLVGVLAAGVVVGWEVARRGGPRWPVVTAASLGLVMATVAYDTSCVVRDACFGAPAPAPLGFRMSGLADTRLATPLLEAAVLLGALSLLWAVWFRVSWALRAALPFAAVALLRTALTPLSVLEWDATGVRTYITAAAGLLAVPAALALSRLWAHQDAVSPSARTSS